MAKSKAKQVFSLKNFIIMFIAIGTLVGLAFWAGRQSKPSQAAEQWINEVSYYAGRTPYYTSSVVASYCKYNGFNVGVGRRSSTSYQVMKIGGNPLRSYGTREVTSTYSAGQAVKGFCSDIYSRRQ